MTKLFCGKNILDLSRPAVMGILNLTPDSFFDGGRYSAISDQKKRVEQMIAEGASIIDIGAVSSRPGAAEVSEKEEMERLLPSLKAITAEFPEMIISVDTFRSAVACAAVEHGAGMINDIYGGRYEPGMMENVASLKVPYILMHLKGTPATMQINPSYSDVVAEVYFFFEQLLVRCHETGLSQIIIDPGFGFGKTVEQNFTLLSNLKTFKALGKPIVAGLSRKSMINAVLHTSPDEAMNGATVLNTIALLKGADILRVHDVKEAVEAVKLVIQTFPDLLSEKQI
ncbi:MAG: dihydropteroate synthase [Bacteroidota bacterium]